MSSLAPNDMVMLLLGAALLIGITFPWLLSKSYRRTFARLRLKTPLPGSPTLAILIITLMGLILVQISLIRPGPGATLESILLIVSVTAFGVLILASFFRSSRG